MLAKRRMGGGTVARIMRRTFAGFAVAGALVACRPSDAGVVGTFPGDWTVYRAIFIQLPDGGNGDNIANSETPSGPDKGEGEIAVAKNGAAYDVSVKARFTTCKVTAQLVKDRIVIDEKQTCALGIEGFRGDADVAGTIVPKGDGVVTAALKLTLRGLKRPAGWPESVVNAEFLGNSNRH